MGHQVEYIIDLPPARTREWLSSIDGRWATPASPNESPWGEFAWGGQTLHTTLGPAACWVCVPQIKYSWLLDPSPSVEWVARFERWLGEVLPGVRLVRLDELLRLAWEREVGRDWDEVPDPVGVLWDWLPAQEEEYGDQYFRLLPAELRHAEPGTPSRSNPPVAPGRAVG